MKRPDFTFVEAARVRGAVVAEGDIRGDIEFQNDINGMLARMDEKIPPIEALGWVQQPVVPPRARATGRIVVQRALRLVDGGAGGAGVRGGLDGLALEPAFLDEGRPDSPQESRRRRARTA
jgi:hypothetical protein